MRDAYLREIAIAATALFACGNASADEFYSYGTVTCDAGGNSAEIGIHASWNDSSRRGNSECELPKIGLVRMRYEPDDSMPGGNSAEGVLSVWVNRVKVVTRLRYNCNFVHDCGVRVAVKSEGVLICTARSDTDEELACALSPWASLPTGRDSLEYPQGKEPKRPAEIMAIVQAKNRKFCEQFLVPESESREDLVLVPESLEIKPSEEMFSGPSGTQYEIYRVDIDNDGDVDDVVKVSTFVPLRMGGTHRTMLAFPANDIGSRLRTALAAGGDQALAVGASAKLRIPNDWYQDELRGAPVHEKVKPAWWQPGKYAPRVDQYSPHSLIRDGNNVMIFGATSNYARYAVMRVGADGRVSQECVFSTVDRTP